MQRKIQRSNHDAMVEATRALATGDVAMHGAVMYTQNALLDQMPCRFMSNWSALAL